jgi:hypothetical protein
MAVSYGGIFWSRNGPCACLVSQHRCACTTTDKARCRSDPCRIVALFECVHVPGGICLTVVNGASRVAA